MLPSKEDIIKLCLEKYDSLPKEKKPKSPEWTVLSCIVQHDNCTGTSKVVSLGTGTKCIGSDQLCSQGLILNDSHAEIIARRSFLRYLYGQLKISSISKDDSIFQYDNIKMKFKLKENYSYHFLSTYPPCGDASILSQNSNSNDNDCPVAKRIKYDNIQQEKCNVIFTGAKLIGSNKTDLMDQEEVGAVRIKPGKGIRTLSMSCSDKIARWNVLGLQGALLDCIIEKPIYIDSFTFCCNINVKSIIRAFYERWAIEEFINERFHFHKPKIYECSSIKLHAEFKPTAKKEPSSSSLIWCDVPEKSLEIGVSGKKQGTTKKNWTKPSSSLQISKISLLKKFKTLLQENQDILKQFSLTEDELESKTYKEMKDLSIEYQSTWNNLKMKYIKIWTIKPDYLKNFQ